MTQPSFVPISEPDQVRPARSLQVPGAWLPDRPAELHVPVRPGGRRLGSPGPDQGFALRLARRFEERLQLLRGESADDVVVGCALIAARRSALFGRAPCIYDVELALELFGFLSPEAPAELVAVRRTAFAGVGHDYDDQRILVDMVGEEALRLTPEQVAARLAAGTWSALLDLAAVTPATA